MPRKGWQTSPYKRTPDDVSFVLPFFVQASIPDRLNTFGSYLVPIHDKLSQHADRNGLIGMRMGVQNKKKHPSAHAQGHTKQKNTRARTRMSLQNKKNIPARMRMGLQNKKNTPARTRMGLQNKKYAHLRMRMALPDKKYATLRTRRRPKNKESAHLRMHRPTPNKEFATLRMRRGSLDKEFVRLRLRRRSMPLNKSLASGR